MRAEPYTDQDGLRDYRLPPDSPPAPRWPGRALLILIGFVIGLFCGAQLAHAAEPCVRLHVRPLVMIGWSDLDVQMRVTRHADHRHLRLDWRSDRGSAGASERQLEGEASAVHYQHWLRTQPPANYDVEATVHDDRGRIAGRDRARILAAAP